MIIGLGSGAGEWPLHRFGAFDVGENALLEALTKAFERMLDPLDITQVGTKTDNHSDHAARVEARAKSIRVRILRTLSSSPMKIASPMR